VATEATNIGGFQQSELSAELATRWLTIAHHSQREALGWDDLVEAMTTLEAGTAVGVEHTPEESRAVAIHDAGHAAAGPVHLKGAE
jgi:hypothetical protein